LASSLALFGVALANPASAADSVTNERLAGATRYGTAAAIAGDEAFAAPTTAIVASGESTHLADALAASTLAGANTPAPIILTQTDTYTAEAKAGLAALKGKGVSAVTIVGGTAAVSQTVEDAIKADGFTVTRVAGADRFATAAAVSTAADAKASAPAVGGLDTALIASGTSFADALAGSPAAANGKLPLLLVNADSVPQATTDAITSLGIKKVVILGGTVPVSDTVANQLATQTGNAVTRLAGANRFATAAAIGDYEIDTLGFTATSAILANGITLVDALTAGPLGGIVEAPIVLTASLPAESQAFLDDHSDTITKLYVAGGTSSVDDATVTSSMTAAQNTANDPDVPGSSQTAALVAPELQSVGITDADFDFDLTTNPTDPELGTIEYTFTFDSDVDEDQLDANGFKLYTADGTPTVADEVESSGPSVAATFSIFGASGTLAAVETGAVQDEDGNENPAQSISIGGGAPNRLKDADVTDADEGEVTFTFSSTVLPVQLATGSINFSVVTEGGEVETLNSTSSDVQLTPDEDDPSTTVQVTYDDLADDGTNDPDVRNIVRAYITKVNPQTSAVTGIQNVDIRRGGDVEDTPDLEGYSVDDNEITFTFDEDIDSAADASNFHIYYGVGSGTVEGTAIDTVDGTDNEVTVTFPDEAMNELMDGVFVDADAVEATESGEANIADGENGTFAAEKGEYAGPQVSGVSLVTDTDSFGDFNEYQLTYTFDRDVQDTTIDASDFSVFFDEDGETVQVELDECEVDDDNTVVCTDDDEDSEIAGAVVAAAAGGAVDSDEQFDIGDGAVRFPSAEASFTVALDANS
jgi:putative cell wall-binding protein